MKKRVIIVGGGISGLSTLHYLKTLAPDVDVQLFEATDRLGGVIGSDFVDGYMCEWGPNGILDRSGAVRELCEQLGIDNEIEFANENSKNRFILREGQLRVVPMSPGSLITSRLLTTFAKLRLLREPFTSSSKEEDESIQRFAERHFGKEVADYLIQPMVTGIHAGQAEQLSVKSCFPLLHELDGEFGSLIRGMITRKRRAKKQPLKDSKRKGSMRLLSLKPTGVYVLIDALAKRYADSIHTGKQVESLEKIADVNGVRKLFGLRFKDQTTTQADEVILALPAYCAARILRALSAPLSTNLSRIPYAPITVVCLGFPLTASPRPLKGFGFLIPPKENRAILGAIWSSSIFSGRAPDGKFQLRILLGGAGNPEVAQLTDAQTLETVADELHDLMGISEEPEMVRIYRWNKAIPQYMVGHSTILRDLENNLSEVQGLHLTGNAYHGVGVSECIINSESLAQKLAKQYNKSFIVAGIA